MTSCAGAPGLQVVGRGEAVASALTRIPHRGIILRVHTLTYKVPGVSCAHCQSAITAEVSEVAGVASVAVDLDRKLVTVTGDPLDEAAIVAAIDEAGYDVEA